MSRQDAIADRADAENDAALCGERNRAWHLARAHELDAIAHFRRLRQNDIGKARLCSTVKGRQTWTDLAREANYRLIAAKRANRLANEGLRFGDYGQRQVARGVWTLKPLDALRAAGAL